MQVGKVKCHLLAAAVAGAGVAISATYARASTIAWDTATTTVDYTNAAQVFNADTYVDSFTMNSTGQSVNGVNFNPYSSGISIVTFSGSSIVINGGTSSVGQFPGSGSTATSYSTVLSEGYLDTEPSGAYIQFNGLTQGTTYHIQLWSAPASFGFNYTELSSDPTYGSDVSPTLVSYIYNPPTTSEPGSTYVDGTFVADATGHQDVYFKSNDSNSGADTFLAAGVIESVPVPEPVGAMSLLGVGMLSLLSRRRRA